MTEALIQGTDEWRRARCGSLGASQLADALAKTKTGWGASRENLLAQLLAERLSGVPTEGFTSAAMQHGIDTEPEARSAYSFRYDCDVAECGLIRHPLIKGTHASPDGLVGELGMVEIKCPNTATHLATLLGASIPQKYLYQMQWQMACTGRDWCDFVSYDPRLPEEYRLYVHRVHANRDLIAELETEVRAFLAELAKREEALRAKYERPRLSVVAAG